MDPEAQPPSHSNLPEEEINEQPTFCNLCQELPEEYIALSCYHNFCLLCLTKLCFESSNSHLIRTPSNSNEDPDKKDEFQIICPLDNKPTPLNSSSMDALNKVKENFSELENKRKPVYNQVIFEESAENFHTTDEFPKKKQQQNILKGEMKVLKNSFYSEEKDRIRYLEKNFQSAKELTESQTISQPTPVKQVAEKNTTKKLDLSPVHCSSHANEDPIIVCFSCGNKPLCVECVVNGEHKNHDMVNISRIKENCKEALLNLGPEIEQKQRDFQAVIEKLAAKKKLISDKIWEIKSRISQDINELKERLINKENELLVAKDCEASEKFAEIDEMIQGFQEKVERLGGFHQSLEAKSENTETFNEGVELLNYFSCKKEEITSLLAYEIGPLTLGLEDLRVDIDKSSFLKYLDGIHNLHLTTSNLNEIEEKMRTSQKFFNPSSDSKVNIEQSIVFQHKKEISPPLSSNLKTFPIRIGNYNSFKLGESPLKSAQVTNSSFNISFVNENSRLRNLKWGNRSLGQINQSKRYQNFGSKTSVGKFNSRYLSGVKKRPEDKGILGVSRALESQNQLFQKRKEFFYG